MKLRDLVATFADLVGVDLPDDAGEDSFSILPSLLGAPSRGQVREAWVFSGGIPAIRQTYLVTGWRSFPGELSIYRLAG